MNRENLLRLADSVERSDAFNQHSDTVESFWPVGTLPSSIAAIACETLGSGFRGPMSRSGDTTSHSRDWGWKKGGLKRTAQKLLGLSREQAFRLLSNEPEGNRHPHRLEAAECIRYFAHTGKVSWKAGLRRAEVLVECGVKEFDLYDGMQSAGGGLEIDYWLAQEGADDGV